MRKTGEFTRIGVVIADATRSQVDAVRSQGGVTYVEGGAQPIDFFSQTLAETSNTATRGAEAAATLTGAGYDASRHRARTFDADWHDAVDLVLVMDAANLRDVGGPGERTRMFRDLDPVDPGAEVPDPYYGGAAGFEEVLRMVERTSASLVAALEQELCPR